MAFANLGMAPIPRSTDCGLMQTKVTRLGVNFGEMFKVSEVQEHSRDLGMIIVLDSLHFGWLFKFWKSNIRFVWSLTQTSETADVLNMLILLLAQKVQTFLCLMIFWPFNRSIRPDHTGPIWVLHTLLCSHGGAEWKLCILKFATWFRKREWMEDETGSQYISCLLDVV